MNIHKNARLTPRAPDRIRAPAGPYNDTSSMEFTEEHGPGGAVIVEGVTT